MPPPYEVLGCQRVLLKRGVMGTAVPTRRLHGDSRLSSIHDSYFGSEGSWGQLSPVTDEEPIRIPERFVK
jgi:hypothetical protein